MISKEQVANLLKEYESKSTATPSIRKVNVNEVGNSPRKPLPKEPEEESKEEEKPV